MWPWTDPFQGRLVVRRLKLDIAYTYLLRLSSSHASLHIGQQLVAISTGPLLCLQLPAMWSQPFPSPVEMSSAMSSLLRATPSGVHVIAPLAGRLDGSLSTCPAIRNLHSVTASASFLEQVLRRISSFVMWSLYVTCVVSFSDIATGTHSASVQFSPSSSMFHRRNLQQIPRLHCTAMSLCYCWSKTMSKMISCVERLMLPCPLDSWPLLLHHHRMTKHYQGRWTNPHHQCSVLQQWLDLSPVLCRSALPLFSLHWFWDRPSWLLFPGLSSSSVKCLLIVPTNSGHQQSQGQSDVSSLFTGCPYLVHLWLSSWRNQSPTGTKMVKVYILGGHQW